MKITFDDNFIGFEMLEKKIKAGINMGLIEIGEDIENDALPITPKLTGDLRESVYVDLQHKGSDISIVEVSFGDLKGLSSVNYAWEQEHGDELGYKNYTTSGTGPRFLSKALNKNEANVITKLSTKIKGILKI